MYSCPYCDYQVPDAMTQCPSCDADVTALALLHELPDVLFNRALQAIKQGDVVAALGHCGMALQLRVKDPGVWMLLGLIAARQGALALAETCWQTVLMMKRDYAPANDGLKLVQRIRQSNAGHS